MTDLPTRRRTPRFATAADYIEHHDRAVRVILAELAESAGAIGRSWSLAVEFARRNPELARGHLIDAELRLDIHVRLELADTLRPVRRALELLGRELPDDDAPST